MPRYDPGGLDDDSYRNVTVFLLALRGDLAADSVLTPEDLAAVELQGR